MKTIEQIKKVLNTFDSNKVGEAIVLWYGANECISRILDNIDNGFVGEEECNQFLKDIKEL